MASHVGRGLDMFGVGGEEGPDISELGNPEHNPDNELDLAATVKEGVEASRPVDRYDDAVQGEGGGMGSILAPDGATFVHIVLGSIGVVVEGRDNEEQPGEDGEDFVDNQGGGRESIREEFESRSYIKRSLIQLEAVVATVELKSCRLQDEGSNSSNSGDERISMG
ncbi:MAG: hypothetical protein M1829_002506 [Trizodia sp. TS-e1964]|nr:MAG: hypothetical protein M1829_002506 [Trizodia sp. TS-e1964]